MRHRSACALLPAAVIVAFALTAPVGPDVRSHAEETAPQAPPAAPPAPPRLAGPRTGPDRAKALSRYGGTAATEAAVDAGLDWLARHAEPEGGWDADAFPDRCRVAESAGGAAGAKRCDGPGRGQHGEDVPSPFDDAITGLATLAFLGRGHLPGVEGDRYASVVEKSLRRLESVSDVWAVPIATEAFAEAEVLHRRAFPDKESPYLQHVRSGVSQIVSMRQKDGAWGYVAPSRPGSDIPITSLCVTALVTARDAGAEIPADTAARVDVWLDSLEEKKGRLAYLLEGRAYGYTPTTSNAHNAVAIRELLETGQGGARHRLHVGCVAGELPVWKISFRKHEVPGRGNVDVQIGNLNLYQWWYGTMGMFQRGSDSWTPWYGAVKSALVPHQRSTGCASGSWDPEGTMERICGGRVFATALAVLMLEQPYRHRRLRETSGSK